MERRRGRRAKIERYDAEKFVDPMLAEGKTYKEVARAFENATGEPLQISSVFRHNGACSRASARVSRSKPWWMS